jgi:hypothetical protein
MSVWPSGTARATNSLAIAPLAPARLSTITVWPSSGPSFWAMVRAIASLPPPAAGRHDDRYGLVGERHGRGAAVASAAARAGAIKRFMGSSPSAGFETT